MPIEIAEVKRRLSALLQDENLVNEYIRIYGPSINIKNIKSLKEKKTASIRCTEEGRGEDPIYDITVKCPVCNQENIICYEQRAKSQAVTLNKFLVPYFKGTSGYKTVDYTMLATTVCPRCLLASPDKNDFIRKNKGEAGEIKSQMSSNLIMTLQEKIGERRALLKTVTDYEKFFKRPRSDEAAIASIRLSIMRAAVEASFELPYSLYKLGSYSLRIAKILKDMEQDNRDILRESLGYFEEAFRSSNCPSEEIELQVIYIIITLHLFFGDHKTANSYIAVFSSVRNNRLVEIKQNPKLTTGLIDKWTQKAKYLWEDRERKDLFDDV